MVRDVWVGGHVYRLYTGRKAWRKLRSEDEDAHGNVGQTDHAQTAIYVSPDQSDSELRETVVHELLHCLIYDAGSTSELTPTKGESLEDFEERLVSKLSPRLFAALVHNPKLVHWLLGE